MNTVQNPELWLSLVRSIEGLGRGLAWRALHGDGSQDLIGKFAVFANLRDDVKK